MRKQRLEGILILEQVIVLYNIIDTKRARIAKMSACDKVRSSLVFTYVFRSIFLPLIKRVDFEVFLTAPLLGCMSKTLKPGNDEGWKKGSTCQTLRLGCMPIGLAMELLK